MVEPIFFKWERGELAGRLKNFIISARFFRLQSSRAENALRFFDYLGCDNKDIIIIYSLLLGRVG
jgi:hypothetical protein